MLSNVVVNIKNKDINQINHAYDHGCSFMNDFIRDVDFNCFQSVEYALGVFQMQAYDLVSGYEKAYEMLVQAFNITKEEYDPSDDLIFVSDVIPF